MSGGVWADTPRVMNEMRACTPLHRTSVSSCRASQVCTTAPLASSSHYDDALVRLSRHTRVGVATLGLLTKRSLGPCTTTTFFRNLGPWAALRHHVVGKALPLCLEC